LFVAFFSALPAAAEVREHSVELEIYGGYVNPSPSVLDGEATVGGRVGYNLTPRFNLQAVLGYSEFEQSVADATDTGTVKLELWNVDMDFAYNFLEGGNVTPEVHAGFGGAFGKASGSLQIADPEVCGAAACTVTFDNLSEDSFTLNAGAGVRIDFGRLIYLRPVIQTRWYAARDEDQWDPEFTVSLGFKFGGN
jgi:hypothetical protein